MFLVGKGVAAKEVVVCGHDVFDGGAVLRLLKCERVDQDRLVGNRGRYPLQLGKSAGGIARSCSGRTSSSRPTGVRRTPTARRSATIRTASALHSALHSRRARRPTDPAFWLTFMNHLHPEIRVSKASTKSGQLHVAEKRIWWGNDNTNCVPALKRFRTDINIGVVRKAIWEWTDASWKASQPKG